MKRILNYVGSKWSLAEWIISNMPEHEVYLEPFFGSGAVFFNKEQSTIETINDIDGNVVNLFQVIRNNPEELKRLIQLTPYARSEYLDAYEELGEEHSDLERARLFLIRCWMARGGKTSDRTGWRHNINPSTVNAIPDWNGLPTTIIQAAERLKDAQIENQNAITLIERYNRADCLIYADPPYLLETRTKRHYAKEMNDKEHGKLLKALMQHSGPVLLSGYDNDFYNSTLVGWTKVKKTSFTDAANKKEEILWLNPNATTNQEQLSIYNFIE